MASSTTPYATKGRRVALQLEATPGTPAATGPDTYLVPATDFSYSIDRGTGVIDRAAVLDGYPGAVCSVPGSRAASMTLTTEIHDAGVAPIAAYDNYWSHLLLGCGMQVEDDGAGNCLFDPSHEVISGATTVPIAGVEGPQSLTLYHYYIDPPGATPTGVTNYVNTFRGSTGALTLNLNAGEVATATASLVGTLETADWMEDNGVLGLTLPDTFDASVSCKPYVVRSATISLFDGAGGAGNPADVITLSNLSITYNAETPENPDPTQTYGFGISPVLFNTAPTITFSIGATNENNGFGAFAGFLQQFRDGQEASLSVVLDTGDNVGNTMTIGIGRLQYTGVTWGDAGGYTTYEIEAVCVRNPGSSTPPVRITMTRT